MSRVTSSFQGDSQELDVQFHGGGLLIIMQEDPRFTLLSSVV